MTGYSAGCVTAPTYALLTSDAGQVQVLQSLTEDSQWHALMDDHNLKLAWAQARRHLLAESITDEVEIRIFDANLAKVGRS